MIPLWPVPWPRTRPTSWPGQMSPPWCRQWVTNSAPNYGMILVPTTLNSESRFASQERSSTAQRPYLEVVIATSSISLDAQKDTWIYKKADAKNYGTCSSFKSGYLRR